MNDMTDILEKMTVSSGTSTSASLPVYRTETTTRFPSGSNVVETVTTTFDASSACIVFQALSTFCGTPTPEPSCACYSASYFVPKQWKVPASLCANYYSCSADNDPLCLVKTEASKQTGLCTSNVRNWTTASFGQYTAATSAASTSTIAPMTSNAKSGIVRTHSRGQDLFILWVSLLLTLFL